MTPSQNNTQRRVSIARTSHKRPFTGTFAINLDSPSVQKKHLQKYTHRHRRRTPTTPHTDRRTTVATLTVTHRHKLRLDMKSRPRGQQTGVEVRISSLLVLRGTLKGFFRPWWWTMHLMDTSLSNPEWKSSVLVTMAVPSPWLSVVMTGGPSVRLSPPTSQVMSAGGRDRAVQLASVSPDAEVT